MGIGTGFGRSRAGKPGAALAALALSVGLSVGLPMGLGGGTAAAQTAPVPGSGEAAAFEQDIALTENLGRAIYERDTAAYLAAMALQDEFAGDELGWLHGWITVKEGEELKVMFIGEQGGEPRAYFIAFARNDEVYDHFAPPGGMGLSRAERGYWAAREDALDRDTQECSSQYNPVVMPYKGRDGAEGGLFVYLIPASTEAGLIKAGGYQLFDYSADGQTMKGEMPFNTNCLDVEKTGNEGDSLILSHSLTPYPQEHHVFMSLLYGTDVVVVTTENDLVWKVSGGEVSFVEKRMR
ncbi:hypothetical protein [Aquisalinus flavus]|uniref:Uncharacterized protein n=1 Tax=Aquisalinus flavus TaxID=1526572 RepID=A0A8J2Y4S3_9PROT|nr:hypothetical protein [Aquisalinus flavus]MBD0427472.1 hypothetical protein [Aquisalinus flavus]UNE47271.1 hypothetical protein FF099_03955 [Aquisalinus flavus]GGD01266.1 hypothetical protein GCM10011342_07850 [Aquisalinus flavus]